MYEVAISLSGRSIAHSSVRSNIFGDLFKAGGPGSRGGHIIGYAKSGKPIYKDKFNSDMDDDDHQEAADRHNKEADRMARKAGDDTKKEIMAKHREVAQQHLDAIKKRKGATPAKGAKGAKGAAPPTPLAKSYGLCISHDGINGLSLLKAVAIDVPEPVKSPGGTSVGDAIYYTQNGGSIYPPAGVVQALGTDTIVYHLGHSASLRVRKLANWETSSSPDKPVEDRFEVAANNYEGWGWRAGKAANSSRDIFARDLTKDQAEKLVSKLVREQAKELKRLGIVAENTTMAAKDVANSVLMRQYHAYKQEQYSAAGKEWAPAAKVHAQYAKLHGYKLEERAKAARLFYENGYDDHDQTVGSVLDKLQELQNRASGVSNNRYGLAGIGRLRE